MILRIHSFYISRSSIQLSIAQVLRSFCILKLSTYDKTYVLLLHANYYNFVIYSFYLFYCNVTLCRLKNRTHQNFKNIRLMLTHFLTLILIQIILLRAKCVQAQESRPNFIFYYPDTLRAESFNAYGNKVPDVVYIQKFAIASF